MHRNNMLEQRAPAYNPALSLAGYTQTSTFQIRKRAPQALESAQHPSQVSSGTQTPTGSDHLNAPQMQPVTSDQLQFVPGRSGTSNQGKLHQDVLDQLGRQQNISTTRNVAGIRHRGHHAPASSLLIG